MIHAVLFDMDGTITDTEKYYNRTWPEAFHAFGYTDYTCEDALLQRSLNHKDAQKLWGDRYGEGFDFEKVHRYNTKLVLDLMKREGIEIKPGVSEILAYLKEKGIKSAVVTATKYERAMSRLAEVNLQDAFDVVVSASMVERGKPHPDVYLYACQQIGENPEDCMAVEDSPNGVFSAASAGCKTVMVPDLTLPTPDLEDVLLGWTKDLTGLISLIENES